MTTHLTTTDSVSFEIHDLADSSFEERAEDLECLLKKELARQVQDHTARRTLSTTCWLGARGETRYLHLRNLLNQRIDSTLQAHEEAGQTLDTRASAILLAHIRRLCRTWEESEENDYVERLCALGQESMRRHRSAAHDNMLHEERRAAERVRRELSRQDLQAQCSAQNSSGIMNVVLSDPSSRPSSSERPATAQGRRSYREFIALAADHVTVLQPVLRKIFSLFAA